LIVTDDLVDGVVQFATGAWLDMAETSAGSIEAHGNPNVLTGDRGTSRLAQGSSPMCLLVEVRRYNDAPPSIQAFRPPL